MPDDKVKAYDRHGEKITISKSEIGKLYALGGKLATKADISAAELEEQYAKATTGQKIAGAASFFGPLGWVAGVAGDGALPPTLESYRQGVASGATLGLHEGVVRQGTEALKGAEAGKAYEEHVTALREAHPEARAVGELAGMVATAPLGGEVASAAKALPGAGVVGRGLESVAARGVAGRAAASAAELGARGVVEGGIMGAGQGAGEVLLHDSEKAADKLFAATGTGALYGGALGFGLGGAGSLAASGVRGALSGLRGLTKAERAAGVVEEAATRARGKEVKLDASALDAGLRETAPIAEKPFDFGKQIFPPGEGPTPGRVSVRGIDDAVHAPMGEASVADRPVRLTPNAPSWLGPESMQTPSIMEMMQSQGLKKAETALPPALSPNGEFPAWYGAFSPKKGPSKLALEGSLDALPIREELPSPIRITKPDPGLKISEGTMLPREVGLRVESELPRLEAKSPFTIPQPDVAPVPSAAPSLRSALADTVKGLTTAEGAKGLAYDRAWSAIGGGFGLQSTSFAKRAMRYLPNGTRDVGEVLMRKGVIDPKAGMLEAARMGTPSAMLPRIQAEVESVGQRIGEITGASGGRVESAAIMRAIDDVARPYEVSAATRPIGRTLRTYSEALLDSLGIAGGAESVAVQDLLRERKALDLMVFENAALDPSMQVQVKRELRSRLEGLVVDSLDTASGKLKGELANEYKALKKDYLALSIAQEAAEDSAARVAKGASLGLTDKIVGGAAAGVASAIGGPIGALIGGPGAAYASKLVRQHGDAVAATMLYQAAERGTLAKWVQKVDDQIGKASKGLLEPPKKGILKPSEKMPSTKELAKTAMSRAAEFQSDPEAYVERATRQTESMAVHSPEIAEALVARQVSAAAFLASKIPVAADPDPLDPHPAPKMTPGEEAELARYAWYTEKPQRFFSEVARGKITFEGAETAKALMPTAFAELQERTAEALALQLARGNKLPFRQRQLLGVLLDMATTPSQFPEHARFLQKNVQPIEEAPPPPPKHMPMGAMKSSQSALDRLEEKGPGR